MSVEIPLSPADAPWWVWVALVYALGGAFVRLSEGRPRTLGDVSANLALWAMSPLVLSVCLVWLAAGVLTWGAVGWPWRKD